MRGEAFEADPVRFFGGKKDFQECKGQKVSDNKNGFGKERGNKGLEK